MADLDPALRELADAYGVATEFWDWHGRRTAVAADTVVAVLRAMDVDASTGPAVSAALAARRREPWTRTLPWYVVTRRGRPVTFPVHVPHGDPVAVWAELEDGTLRHDLPQRENWAPPYDVDGRLIGEATFEIPADLPLGYHTLHARRGTTHDTTALIVTPDWLGCPERMGARRLWGMATQLYSVHSAQSWGVGDLADLADLAVWSASRHGAGFLLVNPLHAAAPVAPMEPSPYLPTTRRFANPLYLRVEAIPEYAHLDAPDRERVRRLQRDLGKALAGVDRVDRDTAWAAKREALALVRAVPRSAGRELAYRAYREREGTGLDDFATWCALADRYGPDWTGWPEPLRDPRTPEVAAFRAAHHHGVDFHRWAQWVLDEQLDAAQGAARRAGMTLGVLHDLAVGVHPHGAEVWGLPEVFARGVTVGAPPDAFNQLGQDWSQPPWRPDRLAELAFEPFRRMVATVLRHAGGVRIDHVIGLFRLWWIPAGRSPTQGTYVRYDHEALVGILALEAARAGALVVGEDLGVVEPWVRDHLRERGILGTSVLWFERDYDAGGGPLPPHRWREYCLATVTTHDLPPTAGYLAGDHVRLRDSLGLLTRPLAEEIAAAGRERHDWLAALRGWLGPAGADDGAVPAGGPAAPVGAPSGGPAAPVGAPSGGPAGDEIDPDAVLVALHRYLAATPARLLGVALTDAVGERRTQNQPGTTDEYPNWRVPLGGPDGRQVSLEEVFDSARVAALAAVVRDA